MSAVVLVLKSRVLRNHIMSYTVKLKPLALFHEIEHSTIALIYYIFVFQFIYYNFFKNISILTIAHIAEEGHAHE
jgi:hypothetical protein